jgi:hypothetical protein
MEGNSRLDPADADSHSESRDADQRTQAISEFVKRDCTELAYCESIAVSTKHFGFSKLPVFSTKVTERFKISPDPIGKSGGAKLHQFSPTGEGISYTTQASELWITDGSSLTPAAEILENAFQWWRKFIGETLIS